MRKLREQIKMYRRKKGWSQQKLAQKSGLSYCTITKLEQGAALHPTIQTVIKISDALNMSIGVLIGSTPAYLDD